MSELVVADVHKLTMSGSKFVNKTNADNMFRKAHVVERHYAEEMTENWVSTGRVYVIDEEATKKLHTYNENSLIERNRADEARKTAGKALANMAAGINDESKVKTSSDYKVDELEKACSEMSIEELKAFFAGEKRKTAKELLEEFLTQ